MGRISNIVGDKSTGKTLLAIEAAANFSVVYPAGLIAYREAESAFDKAYAEALGMPLDRVDFWDEGAKGKPFDTVEDFFDDVSAFAELAVKLGVAGLYVLDSLDALSDREEMRREIDKGSYGAAKAKKMSEAFRRMVRSLGRARIHLMIISQVRDKIGVVFGDKHSRTGGRALDFYASQVLFLSHVETLSQKRNGVTRTTGIRIRARCKKNKIALPFRECEFVVTFGYGIDNLRADVEWLAEVGRLDVLGLRSEGDVKGFLKEVTALRGSSYWDQLRTIDGLVLAAWREIEQDFLPTRHKYGANE